MSASNEPMGVSGQTHLEQHSEKAMEDKSAKWSQLQSKRSGKKRKLGGFVESQKEEMAVGKF